MSVSVTVSFSNGETLEIKGYTGISISRNGRLLDVNITNTGNNLALNTIYDGMLDLLGEAGKFSVAISAGENSKAVFGGAEANYYNSGDIEVLHFTTRASREADGQ